MGDFSMYLVEDERFENGEWLKLAGPWAEGTSIEGRYVTDDEFAAAERTYNAGVKAGLARGVELSSQHRTVA